MSIDTEVPLIPTTAVTVPPQEDETEWEDVPEPHVAQDGRSGSTASRETSVRSGTPGSPRTITRRRKTKAMSHLGQTQGSLRRMPSLQPQLQPQLPAQPQLQTQPQRVMQKARNLASVFELSSDQIQDALAHMAAASVRYIGSVLTHAFQLLKKPLGFLLFLYFLAYLLSLLLSSFRSAIEPMCWVPGISSTAFCRPPQVPENATLKSPRRADYPRLVEIQSASFEQLLDGAIGGPALNLDIKKTEMATRDLITLVKHSGLKSRDMLGQSLYSFVLDAKKAGKGLAKLTARINGAVDNVMTINDYALHTIESAQAQDPGALMRVLWPFRGPPPSRAAALAAFQQSMDVHASELQRLILEAEVSAANLDALDVHLDTLHEICTREHLDLGAARDALLAELWTVLGGNRDRVRAFNTNLGLLRELGEYRKRAAAHVAAAAHTLQAMGEDMEDLRDRVAAPDLLGDTVPMEVHMKSIKAGLERLKDHRIQAKEREEKIMNKFLAIED